MSLVLWDDPSRPVPREGDAIFDTKDGWHHAMIHQAPLQVTLQGRERINVIHMMPPLVSGEAEITKPGETHWLGTFAELESGVLESIYREALRLLQLVAPSPKAMRDYDFRLHGVEQSDPNSNGRIVLRASCSSLLEHCYDTEGVDLVKAAAVPEITSAKHLGEMIGKNERSVNVWTRQLSPKVAWPCKILFPSYQMRAFEKELAKLPYEPSLIDHPYTAPTAGGLGESMPSRGTEEDADLD